MTGGRPPLNAAHFVVMTLAGESQQCQQACLQRTAALCHILGLHYQRSSVWQDPAGMSWPSLDGDAARG